MGFAGASRNGCPFAGLCSERGWGCDGEPLAQPIDCASAIIGAAIFRTAIVRAASFRFSAPSAFQPLDAGIEPLAVLHAALCFCRQSEHLHRIAEWEIGNEPAMAAKLQLAEFASEIGPLVKQPCKAMHHTSGGAQRFTAELDMRQIGFGIIVGTHQRIPVVPMAQPVEHRARLVSQSERLGIERFDDARIEVGHKGHVMRIVPTPLPAQPSAGPPFTMFLNCAGTIRWGRMTSIRCGIVKKL